MPRPLYLAANDGFTARELNRVRAVVIEHIERIRSAWNEHCAKG